MVLTLIAGRPQITHSPEAGAAFATPTIIHFGAALLLSALLRVPWGTITALAFLLGITGFGGAAYALIVARHIRRQPTYQPEFEDWVFYFALPLAAYATLAARFHTRDALFGVAGAALVLLFVGIHNAWDSVSYHVFSYKPDAGGEENQDAGLAKKTMTGSAKDNRFGE